VPSPPTITIVIPTYNAMAVLPGCVSSIVDVAGELLGSSVFVKVQDGMSQDGVLDYIEKLPHAGISISQEADDGIYDAMNKAVAGVDTNWVYFLGADDRLLPGFNVAASELDSPDSIYYGDVLYSSDLEKYGGKFTSWKLIYRNICHQAIFYPARIIKENPFQIKFSIKADWVANICLMSRYNYIYLEQAVAIFNNTDGTSSNDEDKLFDAEKNGLVRTNFGLVHYLLSLTAPLVTAIYQMFRPPRR
jgi:glycosyltransferase involved in cell wall biosynthesis